MKKLIVCYSMSGNVANVSEKIAGMIGADVLRLYPEKAYPDKGMKKFLWGGKSALMAETPPLVPYETDVGSYDLIVIAYPVWASTFLPPVRTFLRDSAEKLKGKKTAAVACYAGSGAEKSFDKLRAALGIDSFEATLTVQDVPKSKPEIVQTNEENIRLFAEKLTAK